MAVWRDGVASSSLLSMLLRYFNVINVTTPLALCPPVLKNGLMLSARLRLVQSQVPKKLYKLGQNRWWGIRPMVQGVAMNPIDQPHGGGEGKNKSSGSHGKGSRTPWGKPTKGGYKAGPNKRRK